MSDATAEFEPDYPSASLAPPPLSSSAPQSLLAAAQRLTHRETTGGATTAAPGWQNDAWDMYDLVGEQRFLATTLAGRMSQARFYVGTISDEPSERPEPLEDGDPISDALSAIGDGASGLAQIVYRLGINLFVAGECWLAGIPPHLLPSDYLPPDEEGLTLVPSDQPSELVVDDLTWRVLSVSEVSRTGTGEVTLRLGAGTDEVIRCDPDAIFLIRVWRPHPRKWWEADSPTRSSLAVLRELVGLTMHISAQVDSRLAGAGLLLVPQSAQRALNIAAGQPPDSTTDQFTPALMEAMLTPIQDRANASALVPLIVTVPDEAAALFTYLTFAKPLDAEARALRDEAIRRLALGQDAPPELLLGTGGMNHWGAWLVREDVVTTHIEPPLALICDALTTQYLWPVLLDGGMSEEEAHRYVVWYDVSHMIMRPNQSADAMVLHERGAITDAALRDATGFSDSDAPITNLPPESLLALEMARENPTLFVAPGLPAIVAQIRALQNDDIPQDWEPETPEEPVAEPVPESEGDSDEPLVGLDGGPPRTSPNDAVPPDPSTGEPEK